MTIVRIDGTKIHDWDTFHSAFAEALGFPDFYGRNMNAWIDCLSYADDPDAGMTDISVPKGGILTLQIDNVDEFAKCCPEQYSALIECAAFVNWRRLETGEPAVLALSFHKS
jgi:hypothetical protein